MEPSHSSSIHSKAEGILHQIRDDRVAAQFDFKATAISGTPFRLLKCIDPPHQGEQFYQKILSLL